MHCMLRTSTNGSVYCLMIHNRSGTKPDHVLLLIPEQVNLGKAQRQPPLQSG